MPTQPETHDYQLAATNREHERQMNEAIAGGAAGLAVGAVVVFGPEGASINSGTSVHQQELVYSHHTHASYDGGHQAKTELLHGATLLGGIAAGVVAVKLLQAKLRNRQQPETRATTT